MLRIRNIPAIPTYRVYRLYDYVHVNMMVAMKCLEAIVLKRLSNVLYYANATCPGFHSPIKSEYLASYLMQSSRNCCLLPILFSIAA